MKIDKITLCNLTSLAGEQVVDFTVEPLRSAGLFAITGDTGAGKSTLLDAVCLALYNKSPRFDGAEKLNADEREVRQTDGKALLQTDDVRNLMRRGCTEAYSRVEFTLEGGRRYEAGWQMSLNRNGKPRPVVQTLRQLGYEGEIRIAGAFGRDQIAYLLRVGADSFVLSAHDIQSNISQAFSALASSYDGQNAAALPMFSGI